MAQKFDVCIRGDGMVGRTLALLLARQRLRVGLVSHGTPAGRGTPQDVRAYSLNSASRDLLSALRCWPSPQHATPVQHMRVWGDDGGFTHFESPTPNGLTWIVDVPVLETQLAEAVRYQAEITCLTDTDSQATPADLTVICEGRHSATRAALGVDFEVMPYQQHAVAARVRCSTPHRQQALQWFSHGPEGLEILALLPMGGAQGDTASLVWSLPPTRAQAVLALDATAFAHALEDASQGVLGQLTLTSERAMWPLQLARAQHWTGQFADGSAWALAGDAAHNIHPLAGLGLNLGLADVAELAEVLKTRDGKDYWRNAGDRYFLRRYERARKAGLLPTWVACDGLQRLFAHPNTGVQALRNWGMSGFNSLAPIKAWAMQQAMG
ncbi:FAD-dependent monooxygenase [Limnohabitans sp. TS-CS-82]|uniref:FAD-dependent monooxygenase n=1 Tax=Limnohabitans sp. TS-CS-82 TaxID=2094193 RepID=UPI00191C4D14|nr:FAD-dependent monooxygenase [Limnohabitans sp. TS-CS-82]